MAGHVSTSMPVTDSFRRPYILAANTAFAFALMFALAWPAIEFSRSFGRIAAVWPANAVFLALILTRRSSLWPAMIAAGFGGSVLANVTGGDDGVTALILALCNTVDIVICAYGLRRLIPGASLDLSRQSHFGVFACVAMAGPILTALLVGAFMRATGQDTTWRSTVTWALSDILGLFILTPALLILARGRSRRALALALRSRKRLPLVLFGLILIASAVGPWHSAFLLAPPVLVLIALEYEMAGAAASLLVLSLVTCGLALVGLQPELLSGGSAERLLRLQGFLAITAAVVLPLGAVVTHRTRWRRELASARDHAEAASAAKGEFLANMSHELRTPLTSIIGFAGLLRTEALDERQSRYVRRISDASQALLAVINDILDFSRLEAGELELDPQPVDPDALIRQTIALVSLEAEAKGLGLRFVNGGLPRAVHMDEARFRQVLLNLLSNAVKFTDAGEVCVTAEHWDDGAAALRVSVVDTGPGVPPDRLDRLFQRFSQADSSISRRYGGSGLGLAICRRLVELMGGAIDVETAQGRGSTFTFDVLAPVAPPAASQDFEVAPFAAAAVLLVDDAAANRELVRTLLEALGVQVTEAESGEAALILAKDRRFELILLDVRMPGLDGLAVTRTLRGLDGPNRHTPILALTADVQHADVEACRAAGMDDHIAKPVNVADLLSKMARWHGATRPLGAHA
jgi:signal transduction histidine kinase/CheY-like chemotaxis protein